VATPRGEGGPRAAFFVSGRDKGVASSQHAIPYPATQEYAPRIFAEEMLDEYSFPVA
jgi:hypothetical protein